MWIGDRENWEDVTEEDQRHEQYHQGNSTQWIVHSKRIRDLSLLMNVRRTWQNRNHSMYSIIWSRSIEHAILHWDLIDQRTIFHVKDTERNNHLLFHRHLHWRRAYHPVNRRVVSCYWNVLAVSEHRFDFAIPKRLVDPDFDRPTQSNLPEDWRARTWSYAVDHRC